VVNPDVLHNKLIDRQSALKSQHSLLHCAGSKYSSHPLNLQFVIDAS